MPASLFCNCIRCCKSSARHAFSPPWDLRTCRNALACTTNNAATTTITKRAMMVSCSGCETVSPCLSDVCYVGHCVGER